jgi:hypothetical protein
MLRGRQASSATGLGTHEKAFSFSIHVDLQKMIQMAIATTEDCPTEAISKSTAAMDARPCILLGISPPVIVAIGIEFQPLSLAESLSRRCWRVLSLRMMSVY